MFLKIFYHVYAIFSMTEVLRQKMVLNILLTAKCENFWSFHFQFLYDLIINKARKLEVAESNLIMVNISSSLAPSVSWGFFPSLSRSHFFLSHTTSPSLSLSFLNSFVDAALQLL